MCAQIVNPLPFNNCCSYILSYFVFYMSCGLNIDVVVWCVPGPVLSEQILLHKVLFMVGGACSKAYRGINLHIDIV
jgi:hypothetical protein